MISLLGTSASKENDARGYAGPTSLLFDPVRFQSQFIKINVTYAEIFDIEYRFSEPSQEYELYWPVENCIRTQQCWASAIKKYPGWETFDVKDCVDL